MFDFEQDSNSDGNIDEDNSYVQSNYYAISEFNSLAHFNHLSTILNYNIRSFFKNIDQFLLLLDALATKPTILILTETWLVENNYLDANIPGYNAFHTIRKTRRSGGVSIFVRNSLNASKIDQYSKSDTIMELCVVKVCISHFNLNIFGIYRSHERTIEDFDVSILEILNGSSFRNSNMILAGDLNFDYGNSEDRSILRIICNLQSLNFIPLIKKPSRFNNSYSNGTILDQIWINFHSEFQSGLLLHDTTDHLPTFLKLKLTSNSLNPVRTEFRLVNVENLEKIERALLETDWSFLRCDDLNDSTLKFLSYLDELFCKFCPLKIKYISSKRSSKPWITSDLLKCIKTKSHYFKLFKQGLLSFEIYRQYRNRSNRIIEGAKDMYYECFFSQRVGDRKKTWNGINILMGREKSKGSIDEISLNDRQVTNREEIASNFNQFFGSIAQNLADSVPLSTISPTEYIRNSVSDTIFLSPMSPTECEKIIDGLRLVKCGKNSFPVKLFKMFRSILSEPITYLINTSFSTGNFPSCLKLSNITPIFKSGDKKDIKNYRPISVLPFLSKIFEKAIVTRILSFAYKNKVFSSNQFGFLKQKSTCDAILDLVEHIYDSINNRKVSVSVFLDLSRAFDTVDRGILLDKLKLYGIRGLALKLLKSYLGNRTQCVRLNGITSGVIENNLGVPQGSMFGPLLFLFYINDLPSVSNSMKTVLYADDTTIISSNTNIAHLNDNLNRDLERIYQWMCANRLSINFSKTVAMLFTTRSSNIQLGEISINNETIQFHNEIKFLGVHFDPKLKFDKHIDVVCKKLSRIVGAMYRIRKNLPSSVIKDIYYTLVYPHLIYCNLVWAGTSQNHLENLVLLQKKVIRIICNVEYLAHTNELFWRCKILKFLDLRPYFLCLYFYKNPSKFPTGSHAYSTRNRDQPVPTFQRLSLTQRSIFFEAPHAWNELPPFLKNIKSYNSFKYQLKQYFIDKYVPT